MIRIAWVGFHEEGLQAFSAVLRAGYPVSGFITLSDEAFAKRSAGSRAYEQCCREYGVPYHTVDTIKGDEAYSLVRSMAPDLLVVLGWSEILPERLLKIPTIGTVGTHAALLPHNKGSAPINWAVIHGETVTGNTMMWLDPEVDSGKIIDQKAFDITMYDTCGTLYEKVAATNAEMLVDLLRQLDRGVRPESPIENRSDEPILPRRRPKDGLMDWRQPAGAVYNFIRALTDPYPGAFTYLNGQKWLIWKAALLPVGTDRAPGTIVGRAYGFGENASGYLVAAGDGLILVTEMQAEDGRRYTGQALNGLALEGRFADE